MKENAPPPPQKNNSWKTEKNKKPFCSINTNTRKSMIEWLKIRILASGKLCTNSFVIF